MYTIYMFLMHNIAQFWNRELQSKYFYMFVMSSEKIWGNFLIIPPYKVIYVSFYIIAYNLFIFRSSSSL